MRFACRVGMAMPRGWTAFRGEIEARMMEGPRSLSADTAENLRDLISYLEDRAVPPRLSRGSHDSMGLRWDDHDRRPLEIVVFGDRFDVYEYNGGTKRIRLIEHDVGYPLPDELLDYFDS